MRIAVTGLGATTPIGGDVASNWSALIEGRSGIRTLTEPWVDEMTVHFAGTLAEASAALLQAVRESLDAGKFSAFRAQFKTDRARGV